jgi:hypothetical protein
MSDLIYMVVLLVKLLIFLKCFNCPYARVVGFAYRMMLYFQFFIVWSLLYDGIITFTLGGGGGLLCVVHSRCY